MSQCCVERGLLYGSNKEKMGAVVTRVRSVGQRGGVGVAREEAVPSIGTTCWW